MSQTLFTAKFKLRPLPGSRVALTSAHTQGTGDPITVSSVKGLATFGDAVSVTAAHLQVIHSSASKRGCCPNVAR